MDTETIFWLEIVIIALQLVAVYVMSNTLIAVTKSDIFKEKLINLHNKKEETKPSAHKTGIDHNSIVKTILIGLVLMSPSVASALSPATSETSELTEVVLWIPEYVVYSLGVLIIVLSSIILYFRHLIITFLNIDKQNEVKVIPIKERISYKVMNALTDVVSIEDESSVLTDHEYDGIKELDNNLPPWWKYGFYASIVIGVIYFTHYHVIKTGDLQTLEYEKVIEAKEIEVAAYLKSKALNVDENSVVMLNTEAELLAGKSLFGKYCVVCHQADGGGKVGPNLTDPYWIYDGDIAGLFSTIKYGAKRGMKSWKDELNPVQIQKLSSYILTLQGTNPTDPKAPEGDFFEQPDADPIPENDVPNELETQENSTVAENN